MTPTPGPTPTPTAEEEAAAHLSTILPWIIDPPDEHHAAGARALVDAWLTDAAFAEAVARVPWVADGILQDETWLLDYSSEVAGTNPKSTPGFPWYVISDVPASRARVVNIDMLVLIAAEAKRSPELAQTLLDFHEIASDVFEDHRVGNNLARVAYAADIEAILPVVELASTHGGDLALHVLSSMRAQATNRPEDFDRLTDMEWFADGLTPDEAAATLALTAVGGTHGTPELYRSFLEGHHVQSKTVSLPLSGTINIWVVQNSRFSPDEDLVSDVEDYIRRMENFLAAPFPTSDIILIVVVPEPDSYVRFAVFTGNYIYVAKGSLSALPHELAHYYTTAGPQWLSEGGAEFISEHLSNQENGQRLGERLARMSDRVQSRCVSASGIENLFHYERHPFFFPLGCGYSMGEHLFLAIAEAIGEEQTASALGALHLWNEEVRPEGRVARGQMVYDIFLSSILPDLHDTFKEVYGRLHGGPDLPDLEDDHGDSVQSATPVSFGEPVHGTLDYRFDLDYFQFAAEEGLTYLVDVQHGALRETSVWVYDRHGNGPLRSDPDRGSWKAELGPSGPRVSWVAPEFGDFYAAVENFGGESGPYTLTISIVE